MNSKPPGTAKDDSPQSVDNPWQVASQPLAQWVWDRLAIKRDRHGLYAEDGLAQWSSGSGSGVTIENLTAHFAGEITLGLGVTSRVDECLWVAWDLDNHVTDEATNQNLAYAIVLMNRLTDFGFRPIVEDSDGKGGVHVWVLFSKAIPSQIAFEFAKWAVRDSAEHGLDKIECFPKSPTVQHTAKKCGNYVRIPGKHHKRDHWSRFWGDGEWLNAADSVRLLLHHKGVEPELIGNAMLLDVFEGIEMDTTPGVALPDLNPPSLRRTSGSDVIELARRYVGKIPGAVSGERGHDATYTVACRLVKGFSLSLEQAFELLSDWNTTCVPPWSEAELKYKIQQAANATGESGYLLRDKQKELDSIRVPDHRPAAEHRKPVERHKRVEDQTPVAMSLQSRSVWDAIESPAQMHEVVIDGLVRRGEVVNIIAATKVGKSWLAAGLAFCIATGREWLGRRVLKGNVLLIDNELHDETIQNRMFAVAGAMNLAPNEAHSSFDYVALRGQLIDIIELESAFLAYNPGELALVILDAKYRFFGKLEENSNEHQTIFHNIVDRLAKHLNCVVVLIHHGSKGDQNGKSVTDVGSGGGAQSRAADCHLVIRPHSDEGMAVLDGAVRTFRPVEPTTLRWEFPLWSVADGVEAILKTDKTRGESRQADRDRQNISKLADIFNRAGDGVELSRYELRKGFGGAPETVDRLLRLGQEVGRFVHVGVRATRNGRETDVFKLGCWMPRDENGDDNTEQNANELF